MGACCHCSAAAPMPPCRWLTASAWSGTQYTVTCTAWATCREGALAGDFSPSRHSASQALQSRTYSPASLHPRQAQGSPRTCPACWVQAPRSMAAAGRRAPARCVGQQPRLGRLRWLGALAAAGIHTRSRAVPGGAAAAAQQQAPESRECCSGHRAGQPAAGCRGGGGQERQAE